MCMWKGKVGREGMGEQSGREGDESNTREAEEKGRVAREV